MPEKSPMQADQLLLILLDERSPMIVRSRCDLRQRTPPVG